jgi:hemerythrin-like domain-containing protein
MECADPVMSEQSLYERMLHVMGKEMERIHENEKVDEGVLDRIVDLLRIYADRCHQGEEEEILEHVISMKCSSDERSKMMNVLTRECVLARSAADHASAPDTINTGRTMAVLRRLFK